MSGLLRRIRPARPTAPDPEPDHGATWSHEGEQAHAHDEAAPEAVQPPVPAGTDLDALVGERPTTQRRSRMRRRLRHLRRVREVLLRDLGGMVFEIHRSGQAGAEAQSRLVGGKLARLDALNAELHELEAILDDRRAMVLREPGIGGTCPVCGELHGSDARFCSACGTPVAPGAAHPVTRTETAEPLPALGAAAEPPQDQAPTTVQPVQPHIEGHGEELRSGDPLSEPRR